MLQVDPKFTFWFGVWTNVLIFIAGVSVTHAPDVVVAYAPSVQWFAGVASQVNNIVLTALVGLSSNKTGPLVGNGQIPPTIAKLLLLAVLLASFFLSFGPVRAGDINAPATKAPAFSLGQYPTLNGMIIGIYTEGGASSVNAQVPGVNSSSLTTTQAALGVTLGYMLTPKNSNVAFSIEGDFCVQNFNGANVGLSLQGPLCAEQRAVAWAPWQTLLQMLPVAWNPFSSISAFSPPNGLTTVGGQLAGFGVGAYEKDISSAFAGVQTGKVWLAEPEIVFMTAQRYSNGGALRGWLKIGFPNQSKVIGSLPIGATTASFNTPDFRVGVGAAF